jgi:hypothetical protein
MLGARADGCLLDRDSAGGGDADWSLRRLKLGASGFLDGADEPVPSFRTGGLRRLPNHTAPCARAGITITLLANRADFPQRAVASAILDRLLAGR